MARDYPSKVISNFYSSAGKLIEEILFRTGITVGLDEFEISEEASKFKEKVIAEGMEEAAEIEKKYKNGALEHIPGRTLQESFEILMMRLGARVKSKVEKKIVREKLQPYLHGKPNFNSMTMILSGSRGSVANITNIAGLWGQTSVREGRPKRGFKNRLIAANKPNDVGFTAGGFIQHNFIEGMGAKEYFYHSMGGRQGEVDTGVSTKVSGYLYRRLANALKDLVVNNDETVRTASKQIIQYTYGDDGVFPMKSVRGRSVDVEREVIRLKLKK